MKRSLLILSALVGFVSYCSGADSDPKLFPIWEFGPNFPEAGSVKVGFIDQTGKIVVPMTTDYLITQTSSLTPCFVEGLQPVTVGLNTKWPPNSFGYVDARGKYAIEPKFGNADPFSEGLAAASSWTGPWGRGYIDHTGSWVIKPQFEQAWPFSEGLAQVTTLDKHLMGFIDQKGNWGIQPQYLSESPDSNFSEGLSCVGKKAEAATNVPGGSGFIFGYIDKTGAQVIDFKFTEASAFHEGLAAVRDADGFGYIDKTGKFAFAPRFLLAWKFSEGLARVQMKDGRMAFIDKQGSTAFEVPGVICAEPFSEGLAAADVPVPQGQMSPNGRFHGFIDRTGKFVIAPTFLSAFSFHNGLAMVADKTDIGYIDKTGAFVWKTKAPKFDLGD